MAGNNTPSVHALEKPEKLQDLLKADRGDDCTPCRVVGGGAFLGLSAYSYWSGMNQLERQQAKILASGSRFGMRSRKFGITATSVGLAWLGIWRMFM
ncbi:hypothetical protein PG991_007803 [Apiospora marii]|uniref:Distal membrane-arm assembly complex protein 1-like domain-containing protein n=1 Tax=Apiospora marii TaxID=335849 RepID=A0ABR1RUH0_9PEZI